MTLREEQKDFRMERKYYFYTDKEGKIRKECRMFCPSEHSAYVCFSSTAGNELIGMFPEIRVIVLEEDLSIGEISDLSQRYSVPYILDFHGKNPCVEFNAQIAALERVDEITVWYGDNPSEYCGMLYALSAMSQIKPEAEIKLLNVGVGGFLSVEEALFALPAETLMKFEYAASRDEILSSVKKWKKLERQNKLLRVWEGNEIVSVNEDYFDNALKTYLDESEKKDMEAATKLSAELEFSEGWSINIMFLIDRVKKMKGTEENEKNL